MARFTLNLIIICYAFIMLVIMGFVFWTTTPAYADGLTFDDIPQAAATAPIPTPRPEQGHAICARWPDMKSMLAQRFNEFVVTGVGSMPNDFRLIVVSSFDGATWTLVRVAPTGEACIAGVGKGWHVPGYAV